MRTLSEKFWGNGRFGIPYPKVRAFGSALFSVAVGILFVCLGARGMAIPAVYWWISLLRAHPLDYVSIGLGIVFIATSLYLVRACLRGEP